MDAQNRSSRHVPLLRWPCQVSQPVTRLVFLAHRTVGAEHRLKCWSLGTEIWVDLSESKSHTVSVGIGCVLGLVASVDYVTADSFEDINPYPDDDERTR